MIAQVQSSTVSNYTAQLSGEVPATIGGAPYTIASRHTGSGTHIQKATQYVYERMQAFGLTVSYHDWNACGYSNRNVIGEKIGQTRPNEIVLVVAHLDDQPSPTYAPGADDNASGSVGVLIAAEILRQYNFERTLRFIFFTGEEQGMCGSSQYAAYVAGLEQNIVAAYNMDMIAWNAVDGPTLRLHTRAPSNPGYSGDVGIANTFVNVVSAYGLGGNLSPIVDSDGMGQSDHVSFWNRGYASILAIEDDDYDFDAYYHTTNDRLSTLNLTYFTNYVKASVGTAAHLALPLTETGVLRGTISDAVTLLPISNASVQAAWSASSTYTRTDASGVYTFTLPVATYTLTASAPRYVFRTASGVIVTTTITTTRDIALTPASQIIFAPRVVKNAP
jgi:Zn-dependent M28 family amino/carboxypeptidase